MLTEADIERMATLGEDSVVEFKNVSRTAWQLDANDFAKAVAALANTGGGHVLVGMDDDGTPSGVGERANLDALMRQVSQICHDRIRPSLTCAQRKIQYRGVPILAVEVPAFALDRPFMVDGGCYIRDANRSRPAERDEMIRILQSVDYHYDEQPAPNATMDDLEPQVVRTFMAESRDLAPADGDVTRYLRALKCLDAKGTPTVSGILFFGKNPTRWLPDARISAVRFRGTVMTGDFADRKEIEGRLPAQIEAAIAFLSEHVPAPARIEGFARVEQGIPPEVMREALTNAVIHRDYRATSQVRVFVFDDRVEFVNPGALLNQLTLDSIRLGGISQRRNPVICSLTARAGRRELYGLGVPQMIRLMRGQGLPDPEFSLDGGHFRVVLRRQPAASA